MNLGKNADVGSSGLCGPAPPMERDVDYPAGPADPRTGSSLALLREPAQLARMRAARLRITSFHRRALSEPPPSPVSATASRTRAGQRCCAGPRMQGARGV
ncbi:unnamed protein product [Bubo scandiacus]